MNVRKVLNKNNNSINSISRKFFGPTTTRTTRRWLSSSTTDTTTGKSLASILQAVQAGTLDLSQAEQLITQKSSTTTTPSSSSINPEDTLKSFANLDHHRTRRTGFPEAVFAAGKTPEQVARILDDMARSLNEQIDAGTVTIASQRAILATRVTPEQYEAVQKIPMTQGTLEYKEVAGIISMTANRLADLSSSSSKEEATDNETSTMKPSKRVIVATAGTTDLPVAEEAAVVLEAANCEVERIYDVGVAGLHRIINALPKLQSPDVGCVIVCAGMDGALPSVVGGLVSVPVLAVPTSIGYGVSLGGISAMLTMLNTCAPGVGVLNIDNGFGAAALAYKCIRS